MHTLQARAQSCAQFLGVALLSLLGACGHGGGPISNGNGPDRIIVTSSNSVVGAQFFDMFECLRAQVRATVFFDDGSAGDFTSRVVWSSSSPGTVTVSNGDQPIPTGGFYAHGVVTPIAGGSAVITADYFGLKASIGVNVNGLEDLKIKRVVQGQTVDVPPQGIHMGVGTVEDLTVVATLNGREQNIEAAGVNWTFDVPNDAEATISRASGQITAMGVGGALTARIGFDSCIQQETTTVNVDNIRSIVISTEFAGNPPLVTGNTEKINVFADFGSGPEQDISLQTTLGSSDPTVLTFGLIGATNIATAISAGGPVVISATFDRGGTNLNANDIRMTSFDAQLEAFSVTPDSATVRVGSTVPAQFQAFGTYANGTFTQEITRQVMWTVSDPSLATIGSGLGMAEIAGQALPALNALPSSSQSGAVVKITATDAASASNQSIDVFLDILD